MEESFMAAMIEKLDPTTEGGSSGEALRARLVDHLDVIKRPNDVVRVTQVNKHHFRVNTLTPSIAVDNLLPMYRIVKSQFLFVEVKNGELVIIDQTRH
jgi:hypothetical protein